jgi:hypothetical protein
MYSRHFEQKAEDALTETAKPDIIPIYAHTFAGLGVSLDCPQICDHG